MATIREKNGRWYYTIDEYGDNKKRIRHEHFGGYTKADAQRAYRMAMMETDRTGKFFEPSNMLVEKFLQEWLEKEIVKNMKQNTIDSYSGLVKNHIIPTIGKIRLRELTPSFLQDFIQTLKDNGLSKSTIKSIHSVLKNSLMWAVANRKYLFNNPMLNVKIPRWFAAPAPLQIFTEEEIETIMAHYGEDHKLYLPLRIAYLTGMRKGEILALQWSLIDMTQRTIRIQSTMYDKTRIEIQSTPKTMSSIRTIPFGQSLYIALKRQQIWQQKNSIKYGAYYLDNDFVCTEENGNPLTSNDFCAFENFCHKKFGHGSMHIFRHTHATRLLESGLDLDYVSKRLGHASITVTADRYVSVTDKRDEKAIQLIDKIL